VTVLRQHTKHRRSASRLRAALRGRRGQRFGGLLGGVFLLVAQLTVAAHSHSFATAIGVAPAAESASASCPQCAFAAHSPLAALGSPSLQHAPEIGATVTGPPPIAWCPPALSSPPGRGPPASAWVSRTRAAV